MVATAGLFYVSTGTHGVGVFAWIAPLPVLMLAFDSPGWRAFGAAFAASFLGNMNLVPYLARVLPASVIAGSLTLLALSFATAVLAARFAFLRLPPCAAVFAFPASVTSFEFLQSLFSPHGTAGSLAYSQMDYPPVFQVLSVAGIWGVVFLITLLPSGLALAFHFRRGWGRVVRFLALPALLEMASLAYGWARLSQTDPGPPIRIGLAVTDATVRMFDTSDRDQAMQVLRDYVRRTGALAARGAQIVVLPEKFVGVASEYRQEAMEVLGHAARAGRVTLVAGLNLVGSPAKRNVAVLFGPDGHMLLEYDKARMLPGAEDGYVAGATPGLPGTGQAGLGIAICKDMDFPAWIRHYAQAHVSLLLVPAWDFVQDSKLHSRMAIARAVEGGFALARCAQQGLATVCDSRGRIVAEAASYEAPEQLLIADVRPGAGNTLYSRGGDWFGWTCVILLGVILASAFGRPSH
jgi:apolipoprotein N-acyltransferase